MRRTCDDIPGLVEHFARRFKNRDGARIRGVTAKALRLLKEYPWPGNVRELEHEVQRLMVSVEHGVIDAEMLAERIRIRPREEALALPELGEGAVLDLGARVEELEERLIREALHLADGKQIEAARLLGISRNGLAKKIKRLEIRTGNG